MELIRKKVYWDILIELNHDESISLLIQIESLDDNLLIEKNSSLFKLKMLIKKNISELYTHTETRFKNENTNRQPNSWNYR